MSDDDVAVEIVAETGHSDSPWKLPAKWRLEVRGKPRVKLAFKAAIARDGHLELIEATTPYDQEFTASRLIALFEAVDEGTLEVVAYSDASGAYLKQCSFAGDRGGRILFDSHLPAFQAGSL
jgi:hypothetical protein